MTIRIGILGAAKIAPTAVINPARDNPDFEVVAVGARDPERARAFAAEHKIPNVAKDYDALLRRDDVDLVYNALPPAAHAHWTIAALQAGKHVLCEKPFAMNAAQVRRMNDAAAKSGRKLVEAFHYRHHNVMKRAVEIARARELGKLVRVDADFCVPIPYREGELRWTREQGGGALMDLGCYPAHALRSVIGSEPRVLGASCVLERGVDLTMRAELSSAPIASSLTASMTPGRFIANLQLRGENGTMEIANYIAPQMGCRFTVTIGEVERTESIDGSSTYVAQLAELGDVLLLGKPQLVTAVDSLANMTLIDSIYQSAGVEREF